MYIQKKLKETQRRRHDVIFRFVVLSILFLQRRRHDVIFRFVVLSILFLLVFFNLNRDLGQYFNNFDDVTRMAARISLEENTLSNDDYYVVVNDNLNNHTSPSHKETHDFDLSTRASCGASKCFLASASNSSLGYLVVDDAAMSQEKNMSVFDAMSIAWKTANMIQEKYGAKHYLLQPPQKIVVTDQLAIQLHNLVYQPALEGTKRAKQQSLFRNSTSIIVQKVLKAPSPILVLGCAWENKELTKRDVINFAPLILDKPSFNQRFGDEIKRVQTILNDNLKLSIDFQAIVDLEGNLFHIDLDGSIYFDHMPLVWFNAYRATCITFLDEMKYVMTN